MINTYVDASTQRFALLGGSLPHTWSPQIHNSLFDAAQINAIYIPMPFAAGHLQAVVEVMRASFSGFNVTIPYKEMIIPYLDALSNAAIACGAVNTVEVTSGGKLIGHITDGLGLCSALREASVVVDGVRSLILGNGGAARVAAYELLVRGGDVTIAARDINKAQKLMNELTEGVPCAKGRVYACMLDAVEGAYDLLINCTPVGMYPHVGASPVTREVVSRCAAVFDMIYNPAQTQLMQYAQLEGIKNIGGFGMLFYQAVEAQQIWFDAVAPKTAQRAICSGLERMI